MRPWWQAYPATLDHETDALRAAGLRFEIDPEAQARGVLCIRAWPVVDGREVEVVATYPDLFPYFRFEVRAPGERLKRHQSPFGGTLCLIGRGSANWRQDDTLAAFLTERLPKVLRAASSDDPDEVASLEEHQGEPFSSYYPCEVGSSVLIDGAWTPAGAGGELLIGLDRSPTPELLRGAVLEIRDESGALLSECDPALRASFQGRTIRGRWVRIDSPIESDDPQAVRDELAQIAPQIATPMWERVDDAVHLDIIGMVFPEEIRWREWGDAWVFVVTTKTKDKTKRSKAYANLPPSTKSLRYFSAARKAGREDLSARIPQLRPLRTKTVLIVGCGAVGAPSVLELARASVGELRLIDDDVADPPTSVRWPAGIRAAGVPKVQVLQAIIHNDYPYTKVTPFVHRLGAPRIRSEDRSDLDVLDEALDGVDLIYDAAAARYDLTYVLAELARQRSIPLVVVSTTPGAWGGLIARIPADDESGCYICLMNHLEDGSMVLPPVDVAGTVQPAGCADPTFIGAGFDVASVALEGVRLAVSTLCAGESDAYPPTEFDVLSLSFRDGTGTVSIPGVLGTWRLLPHPACPRCSGQ